MQIEYNEVRFFCLDAAFYYIKILFPVSNRGIASWRIDTEFLCKEQSTLQHFFEMVQGHTQTDCIGKGNF